jgi:hypothetical protein
MENCVGSTRGQVKARISFSGFRFELPKYRENGVGTAWASMVLWAGYGG